MPRIVKWQEKYQLVKIEPVTWEMDLQWKYVKAPPSISSDQFIDMRCPRETLFNVIERIIDETLPQVQNELFDRFVDIKEVPYGRYNSDTNHQGS